MMNGRFLKGIFGSLIKVKKRSDTKKIPKNRPVFMDFVNLIKEKNYFQFAKNDRNHWYFYHWWHTERGYSVEVDGQEYQLFSVNKQKHCGQSKFYGNGFKLSQ